MSNIIDVAVSRIVEVLDDAVDRMNPILELEVVEEIASRIATRIESLREEIEAAEEDGTC